MTVQDASMFPPLPRREFLRVSATAVAGIAATSLFSPSSLFAAASNSPLLSIGYAPEVPDAGEQVALTSAANLLGSDPMLLGRRARITVAGYSRAAKHANAPGGVQLDAVFPVLSRTPEHYPHFNSWSFNGRGDSTTFGGPITFVMPVTATEGIVLLVRRINPDDKSSDPAKAPEMTGEVSRLQLSVNSGGDALLARGAYVLALREGSDDSAPNWSRLELVNQNGFLSIPGIGVSYVILKVGYGTAPDDARAERVKNER